MSFIKVGLAHAIFTAYLGSSLTVVELFEDLGDLCWGEFAFSKDKCLRLRMFSIFEQFGLGEVYNSK